MAARVEGQRGDAVRAAAAREVEVALLRRAGAVEDHDPGRRLAVGQEQRVGEAVELSQLGRRGHGMLHRSFIIAPHGGGCGLARLSTGLAPERARPARGRRLRRDRARARVRHARLRLRRGRHARPGARIRRGVPRARRSASRSIYASKAFPCTAAFRLFAEEGLSADVASAGELHLALAGGFEPERLYLHGNNKTHADLDYALDAGVGHIVVDSFDEIERLRGTAVRALIRVTPGIQPSTHSYIQTGQEDSKFGFGIDDVPRAVERLPRRRARAARAARAHRLAGARARGLRADRRGARRRSATSRCSTSAAGSASPTRATSGRRRSRTTSRRCVRRAPHGRDACSASRAARWSATPA